MSETSDDMSFQISSIIIRSVTPKYPYDDTMHELYIVVMQKLSMERTKYLNVTDPLFNPSTLQVFLS